MITDPARICAISQGPSYPDPSDKCTNCMCRPGVTRHDLDDRHLCDFCFATEWIYHIHQQIFEGVKRDPEKPYAMWEVPLMDELEDAIKGGDYLDAFSLLMDIQRLIYPCLDAEGQKEIKEWLRPWDPRHGS